ncbi:MAG: hypothetical protein WBP85_08465 [Terracidiphilus sp.]
MWTFLFSFLLLRRLGISRPIRIAIALFLIGLIFVVLIYTVTLFLDLEERTNAHHAFTYSIY